MDTGLLVDAIVRQTMVLIAQLATFGGGRVQLAHTANQVFLDLVGALKEQGLGNKVIADMFGMALRTYQTKVQRLSESRTDRGRSLWEALLSFLQEQSEEGAVSRAEVLRRFRHDDPLVVGGVLRDLVDSGLVYRTGRGDFAQYGVVQGKADGNRMSMEPIRPAQMTGLAVPPPRFVPALSPRASGRRTHPEGSPHPAGPLLPSQARSPEGPPLPKGPPSRAKPAPGRSPSRPHVFACLRPNSLLQIGLHLSSPHGRKKPRSFWLIPSSGRC
jgi:hypothetical protein